MPFMQEIIHRFEHGGGMRYARIGLAVLAVIGFVVAYNLRAFKNFSTLEAMDAAQLARNIAEGQGYTTLCVRPVSMYLVRRINEKTGRPGGGGVPDYARIRAPHPDTVNPPVYPVMLAGLMKVLPQSLFTVRAKPPFRYPPEFVIGLFNQVLFLGLIAAVWLLARRLFDPTVAWLSAIFLFGTELFWRFAMSGLSTMLVLLIFTGLLWALVHWEEAAREPRGGNRRLFALAALCGAVVGLGCLTRYAFGWLIVPVVLYIAIFGGERRLTAALLALGAFVVVLAPWMARNLWVSGLPFGVATYTVLDGTYVWPGNKLVRSLVPRFEVPVGASPLSPVWNKLFVNMKILLNTELPRFGAGWLGAFFLAGLLVNFRRPALQRLRYFVVLCLPVLAVVQALGRTHLSDDSPEINTENMLVLLAPIVIVYGAGFFMTLVDQLELPLPSLRYAVMGALVALVSLPLVFVFLPPKPSGSAYPPYHPLIIQHSAKWLKPDELIMTDVPWAVAWYGHRQAIWLTRHMAPPPQESGSPDTFFAINDFQKPINAIYLTPRTTDARFLTEWVMAGERSWANLVIDVLVNKSVPPWCPLRAAPNGFLPEQLFLADWERWRLGTPIDGGASSAATAQ